MHIRIARCTLVALTIASLSGCYSNGKWGMPELAFWKSNPSAARTAATGPAPSAIGAPVKPGGLAAAPGTPAPGAGYTGTGTAGTGPSVTYPSTPAGYTTPSGYPSAIPSNPPTMAGAGAGYGATAGVTSGNTPYMAPQQGPYGQGGAAPYTNPAAPQYGGATGQQGTSGPGAYVAAGTTGPYANPVRSAAPPASGTGGNTAGADRYGTTGTDRYGSVPAASPGGATVGVAPGATGSRYGDSSGAGYSTARGTAESATADSRYSSGATTPSYGSGVTPPYPGDSRYPDTSASGARAAGAGSTVGGSVDRYPSTGYGAAAPGGTRYNDSTVPGAGRGAPASNYVPGATDYRPGSGYTPPGVKPYTSPAGPYTSPTGAGNADDPPPYRPGSTSGAGDYVPGRTSKADSSSRSSEPMAVDSGVRPASYLR